MTSMGLDKIQDRDAANARADNFLGKGGSYNAPVKSGDV